MTFEEFLVTYPEEISSIFSLGIGLIFVPVLLFGFTCIADSIVHAFHLRWLSARCYGLHTGFIQGLLGFLWLVFKRASAIIQGAEMAGDYQADIDQGYRFRGERNGKRF